MLAQIPYEQFLANKAMYAPRRGFKIDKKILTPGYKPHQGLLIPWAIEGGCRGLFCKWGLGKTWMQLDIARIIMETIPPMDITPSRPYGRCKFLIVLPLGVRNVFVGQAKDMGIPITYVRNRQELLNAPTPIVVSNYERVTDGDISPDDLIGVSLDEGSNLRSLSSKTYITFNRTYQQVPYRFVATATPSPNDYIELLNFASFLGIMDVSQAKTRFFKRNPKKADDLELLPHKEREFWMWVFSWGIFLDTPSTLGFPDEGYKLPELEIRYHRIPDSKAGEVYLDDDGNYVLYKKPKRGAIEASKGKQDTIGVRLAKAKELIDASPDDHFLLWHHLEPERMAIDKHIPQAKAVYGKQTIEKKEEILIDFQEGRIPLLATKPEIAGSGNNFQYHCHRAIFMGINYKFHDFIQAIYRIYRFMQQHKVTIDIIYMESEELILKELLAKWEKDKVQLAKMTELIKEYGISYTKPVELKRYIFTGYKEARGRNFLAINGDNVPVTRKWKSNSIQLHNTSIPFSNQYEYTPTYNDFGHNVDDIHFFAQMDYVVPEMYRTLEPGRLCVIHCKDRIQFGNWTGIGFPTLGPFSDKTRECFESHGFAFCGRITIETDVVKENDQTYRLGWTENSKDSSKMGVGVPEYLLIFRKPPTDRSKGYADRRVTKDKQLYTRGRWQIDASSIWRSNGNRLLTPTEINQLPLEDIMAWWKDYNHGLYDYEEHVKLCDALAKAGKLPPTFMALAPQSNNPDIWTNVMRVRTLNTHLKKLEQHICPLPFDINKRVITRWTNPGDTVADVFGGVMSVPYNTIELGRKAIGVELGTDIWKTGVKFLKTLEHKQSLPTLFDVLQYEDGQKLKQAI